MGRVFNHAGKPLAGARYDVMIVGGGLLGLACAYYLRRLAPQLSLLVIEQDGVPSELGASYLSPAIVDAEGLAGWARQAAWVRRALGDLAAHTGLRPPLAPAYRQVGCLHLGEPGEGLAALSAAQRQALSALVAPRCLNSGRLVAEAGYGNAESAALAFGRAAVALGADLALNTRLKGDGQGGYLLERLAYTRTMTREVVCTERLQAERVIVAAGAESAALAEALWGVLLPLKRAYMQYPRLGYDPRLPLVGHEVALPVIRWEGWYLRPLGDGLLVVPPPLPADPEGYLPQGGSLMGVRLGVRRELLEQLLAASELLVALSWPTLNLGKTVRDVRGHWEVITESGLPMWFDCGGHYALVGGRLGFTLGLAVAYEVAAKLAGAPLPWAQ